MAQLTGWMAPVFPLPMGREFGTAGRAMIKGYTAKRTAAVAMSKSRTTTAKAKRGRPKKKPEPLPEPTPMQPASSTMQGFPILIPEQLRTCLMAKDDVESAVKAVVSGLLEKWDELNGQRAVPQAEAMSRLHVKSRSTMWHWNEKGYLLQEHDENGHVFYREYKIRRAERGEWPEGVAPPKEDDEPKKKGGQKHGRK